MGDPRVAAAGRRSAIGCVALSGAFAYAVSGGLVALAESPSPVRITGCTVVPQDAPRRGSAQEVIRISFSIDGTVPADEARFVASFERNELKGFVARGLFSKGVIMADRLIPATPAVNTFDALHGQLGCAATYVHFVDGTSWTAAAPS